MEEKNKRFGDLKEFQKSNLRNITHLQLDLGNKIKGDEGAKDLGISLSKCTELTNLIIYIYMNEIKNEGAQAFGLALGSCKKLIDCKLWIYENQIGDIGASGIAAGLSNFTQITSLGLSLLKNEIGDEGIFDIGLALSKCKNLINLQLWLHTNQFGDKGLSGLLIGLNSCNQIKDLGLSLSKNKITDEGYLKMDECLSSLVNLTSLLCVFNDNEKLLKSREMLNCKNVQVLILIYNLCSSEEEHNKHYIKALKIKRLVKLSSVQI
ncbi:cyclic nucleotide-binding domain protein, putative (macronuclear) [Tetrahymena thermophila SB210]|uniref:Cyclic nucleotide-binding domain protein, putative n=1 Tax=Tetrahymena thermophila (strain SB210) TaxID=312017 RepID=Q22SR6_TETTS|nr:cyclic nucleotide-binding domain protein, putative [Tetrahymena thermophila SB210]EAR88309.2 cyclic nucleotide-binding domain protein, putative [Tetrahymena thermophila SB210]|eukprot:XP_001008554.2 cyclic nucleotide-binding domain protein, putative [Tetrahymena thermophila SB210]